MANKWMPNTDTAVYLTTHSLQPISSTFADNKFGMTVHQMHTTSSRIFAMREKHRWIQEFEWCIQAVRLQVALLLGTKITRVSNSSKWAYFVGYVWCPWWVQNHWLQKHEYWYNYTLPCNNDFIESAEHLPQFSQEDTDQHEFKKLDKAEEEQVNGRIEIDDTQDDTKEFVGEQDIDQNDTQNHHLNDEGYDNDKDQVLEDQKDFLPNDVFNEVDTKLEREGSGDRESIFSKSTTQNNDSEYEANQVQDGNRFSFQSHHPNPLHHSRYDIDNKEDQNHFDYSNKENKDDDSFALLKESQDLLARVSNQVNTQQFVNPLLNDSLNFKSSFTSKYMQEKEAEESSHKIHQTAYQNDMQVPEKVEENNFDKVDEKVSPDDDTKSHTSVPNPQTHILAEEERERPSSTHPAVNHSFDHQDMPGQNLNSFQQKPDTFGIMQDGHQQQQQMYGTQPNAFPQILGNEAGAPQFDGNNRYVSVDQVQPTMQQYQNLSESEQHEAQVSHLMYQNQQLNHNLQGFASALQAAENRVQELQQQLEKVNSESQYKIGFLLREKQELDTKCMQQQEMIRKYGGALEQLQRESKAEKEILSSSAANFTQQLTQYNATIQQHLMKEEELKNQLENLQYRLNDTENKFREQYEELNNYKNENECLQMDLKSLVQIEQSLRAELHSKSMGVQETMSELQSENDSLKQDFAQFHQIIERGSQENEGLKQEVINLREELLRKQQDSNQSSNSLADKDNEIFSLKAELARLNALVSTQSNSQRDISDAYNKTSSGLDALLKSNSDSFATDYLRNMNIRPENEDPHYPPYSSFDSTPVRRGGLSAEERKLDNFNYQGPASHNKFPGKPGFPGIKNALPEAPPEKPKKGPKTCQGLPPNSQYKKQEWTPYMS